MYLSHKLPITMFYHMYRLCTNALIKGLRDEEIFWVKILSINWLSPIFFTVFNMIWQMILRTYYWEFTKNVVNKPVLLSHVNASYNLLVCCWIFATSFMYGVSIVHLYLDFHKKSKFVEYAFGFFSSFIKDFK